MREKTQKRLDRRMLVPIGRGHSEGIRTAILSTGYDYAIYERLVRFYANEGLQSGFDTVMANRVAHDGKGSRFQLEIFSPEDRAQRLERYCSGLLPQIKMSGLLFPGHQEKLCQNSHGPSRVLSRSASF